MTRPITTVPADTARAMHAIEMRGQDMPSKKEQYDARQKLKRIARGDDPDALRDDEVMFEMFYDLAERFVRAMEGIEMNARGGWK